jgi:hypothetical protein
VTAPHRFYLTTPIYYASGEPHIGHAYTTFLADALARYQRQAGAKVQFLTGTDEHGQKIQEEATRRGLSPQELCDRMAARFQEAWKGFHISYDRFIRTTEEEHKAVVRAFVQRLKDRGHIYASEYEGWYSVHEERFFTEKELGPGRTDPIAGRPVERIREKNWFFRMSAFQEDLVRHIHDHPDWIYPEMRRNEVLGFLQKPLEDLSISRPRSRLEWGIPLPFDEEHVTYVWVDALINYLTASGAIRPGAPGGTGLRGDRRLLVARGSASHREGHPHHPRGLLAHPPPGGGAPPPPSHPLPRVVGGGRDQDVQVPGERGGPHGPPGPVRERRRPLVSPPGDAHGAGRLLHPGAIPHPVRRVGQRPGEPGLPGHRHGREIPGRPDTPGAGLGAGPRDRLHPLGLPGGHGRAPGERGPGAAMELARAANGYVEDREPWAQARDPEQGPALDETLATLVRVLGVLSALLLPAMPERMEELARRLGLPGVPSLEEAEGISPGGWGVEKGSPLFPRQEGMEEAAAAAVV